MFTNAEITHYSKGDGYSKKFYDAYVEENNTSSSDTKGGINKHKLFISVPADKKLNFSTDDLILLGKVADTIDSTSEESESKSIRAMKRSYQVYTIREIKPCLYGSKSVWHYELGCD